MESYKISVIIPVYNAEKYLEKCLDSVVNQTYKNIEVITVNDASTDNSLKILKKYEKRFDFFKVIDLLENHRQGGARNIGINEASGDYISFVDSDDWIDDCTYFNFNKILNECKCDVICCSQYYREYANGEKNVIKDGNFEFLQKISFHQLSNVEKEQLLFKGSGIWQNLYSSKLIKDNEILFPEKISYEDNYFVPLVYANAEIVGCLDEPFYHYRENLNSTIFRKDSTQLDRIKIEKMRYDEFIKRDLYLPLKNGYEILTLKLYYLITLGTIYKYFKEDFIEKTRQLKKQFYKDFPDFKNNPYYHKELLLVDKIKILAMEVSPYLLLMLFKIKDL